MNQLVPIGRFAALTRLSVKALRHYDEIGLLAPDEVDPSSGYRYYRTSQAARAEAIRRLRDLNLPLGDIRELLGAGAEEARGRLSEHRDRLTGALEEHQRRIDYIERLLTGEVPLMPYTVETKTVDDVIVTSLRRTVDHGSVGEAIGAGFGELFEATMSAEGQPAGLPFIVFHDIIDDDTAGTIELCLPVTVAVDVAGDATCEHLPSAVVASTTHHGPYDEVAPAYHAIAAWMAEHGHVAAGPPRELYLNDPTEVGVEEQLTEVQWPIDIE